MFIILVFFGSRFKMTKPNVEWLTKY